MFLLWKKTNKDKIQHIILSKKEYNSLPYLYVNKGINYISILLYIGIKIVLGMLN